MKQKSLIAPAVVIGALAIASVYEYGGAVFAGFFPTREETAKALQEKVKVYYLKKKILVESGIVKWFIADLERKSPG